MRANKVVTIDDLRKVARRRLPRMLFDFVDGAAEDETSMHANEAAFKKVRLRPRLLRDVSVRGQRVNVLGEDIALPVMLAPVGLARIAGMGGELSAARAASAARTVSVVSTAASVSLENIAKVVDRPQWFQLYPWGNREAIESMMKRAWTSGYRVMVVTVDVPITGGRERDVRNGMTVPPRPSLVNVLDLARHPAWLTRLAVGSPITFANLAADEREEGVVSLAKRHASLINPGHTWEDLGWMRDQWQGKVVLKGVTCVEDARLARQHGCDGIVVSNHGGRQLDEMPGTLEVLPEIAQAVGNDLDVLLDGGVRRGTDVVKALALGAKAVLVGRPWVYGLAADGERGISKALDILREEIDRTLALMGRTDVSELDRSDVRAATSELELLEVAEARS